MKKLFSILLAVVLIAMAIPATVSAAGQRSYTVTVHTGGETGAGTNGTVRFAFNGTNGTTGKIELDTDDYDDFEKNATDTYTVYGNDVGIVTSITVEKDSGWYLGWFEFDDVIYNANAWVNKDLTFAVNGSYVPVSDAEQQYSVTIRTSNIDAAGTDARNFLQIVGTLRTSLWHEMDEHGDDFECGDEDTYTFCMPNVGTVTGINIYSNGANAAEGWYPEWVRFNGRKYYINQWLDDQTVEITNIAGNYSVSVVPGTKAYKEYRYENPWDDIPQLGSILATTDIWFVVSGGVLILAVSVFAVIFVQRRKKKAMVVVSDVVQVDGSDDNTTV